MQRTLLFFKPFFLPFDFQLKAEIFKWSPSSRSKTFIKSYIVLGDSWHTCVLKQKLLFSGIPRVWAFRGVFLGHLDYYFKCRQRDRKRFIAFDFCIYFLGTAPNEGFYTSFITALFNSSFSFSVWKLTNVPNLSPLSMLPFVNRSSSH